MDPATIAFVGTVAGGCLLRLIEKTSNSDIKIKIKTIKSQRIDPHYIRHLEIQNGNDGPYTTCDDPFCPECFGGVSIEVSLEPRERIVDGFLVPVPRGVPDYADAYSQADNLTDNVMVFWSWVNFAGIEKKLRSVVARKDVRSLE